MKRVYRDSGLTDLIVYVMIIAVVAMISLLVILSIFTSVPVDNEKIKVKFYQNGIPISNLTCTLIDGNGYAYYDTKNYPPTLDVLVLKHGKPAVGMWVTMSGCGMQSKASRTDSNGYAHFSLQGIYLSPGINSGYLNFEVSGKVYHLEVIRG